MPQSQSPLVVVLGDQVGRSLLVIGALLILGALFYLGFRQGAAKATNAITQRLQQERASRIERWTPHPARSGGEPGSAMRLLSDYEDAIYAEARHALDAQLGNGDEQQHVAYAAQLHGDVRRLRGQILHHLHNPPAPSAPPAGTPVDRA
ncbi:hypothetical protein [Cumulibacter manganitolerans]|uniref:hypothetical protein n=1 Tax=Cumulibacter manganitolerans TaxID=1884992 RepID=UPI001294F210|nr:hypothetical protein [Cumulibacter manganitolerans]